MGPRSSERGNRSLLDEVKRLRGASMGPRSSERGNLINPESEYVEAAKLQWGRARLSAETETMAAIRSMMEGFNGAALV